MTKKFLKIFLITSCSIVLLIAIVLGNHNENKGVYLRFEPLQEISSSFAENLEKENRDEENNKEKINELYIELTKENIVKIILPRLRAFGIMTVMPDEEYDLEKQVTREELAKLIVRTLNMEEAVEEAQKLDMFTDISADRWSAGYINLAACQGILKAKENETFSPKKSVTYQEAIIALVKVLGYREEFLPGKWPNNFLTKASKLGITKGVEYDLSSMVNRGDIFILIDNTLKARALKIEEYNENGPKKQPKDETFLKKAFGIDQYDGVKILEIRENVNSKDGEKLVKFKFLNDMYNDEYKAGDIKIYKLLHEGNLEELQDFVAKEMTIYIKEDNRVIYIEK